MNNKKILFFDIDGTLLTPHPFKVPESTSLALTKAHENGHLLFIARQYDLHGQKYSPGISDHNSPHRSRHIPLPMFLP